MHVGQNGSIAAIRINPNDGRVLHPVGLYSQLLGTHLHGLHNRVLGIRPSSLKTGTEGSGHRRAFFVLVARGDNAQRLEVLLPGQTEFDLLGLGAAFLPDDHSGDHNFLFVFAQFGVGPVQIERAEKLKPTGSDGFNPLRSCLARAGRILNFNRQGMGAFFEQAGVKDLAESTGKGLGIIGMPVCDIGPLDTARYLNGLTVIDPYADADRLSRLGRKRPARYHAYAAENLARRRVFKGKFDIGQAAGRHKAQ